MRYERWTITEKCDDGGYLKEVLEHGSKCSNVDPLLPNSGFEAPVHLRHGCEPKPQLIGR